MGAIIAVISKKDENITNSALDMLRTFRQKNIDTYEIASPFNAKTEGTIEQLQSQSLKSDVIVGNVFSETSKSNSSQLVKFKDAASIFEGRLYPTNAENMKTALKKTQGNCESAAKTLVRKSEGDFVMAIAETDRIIAVRDPIGVRPLYYGENANLAALASERKALWKIGIKEIESFPPGQIAFVSKDGFKFEALKQLPRTKSKPISIQTAAKKLEQLLFNSIKQKVAGLEHVALAFSGGLDSSVIANLSKKCEAKTHLVHVSLENQSETEHARAVAEELGIPFHVNLYNEETVEKILPDVLSLVEEPDPIKVSIGIPMYLAAEEAAKLELKVMLAGQGADEFFGGYKRYVDEYVNHGKEKAQSIMFRDITEIHKTNLERDAKLCNFHNVELRLPFATYSIATFALSLPLELKIEPSNDSLKKLVLRRVAENLGLSQSVANRPKKAVQYATGTVKSLRRLAKKRNLSINNYVRQMFQIVAKRWNYDHE
jgi:asparagine synthase (glutamine-hydrolysing)